MSEPLPLSRIQEAIFSFLRGRKDAVMFGAHAVNAYVDEPRMSQDVDILSTRAADLVEELRNHLAQKFGIALRVREMSTGSAFRIFQVRKPSNRHLVDVRSVKVLPQTRRIRGVLVPIPAELVALKVVAYASRRNTPKSGTDWRDVAVLLLAFPDLKTETGAVADKLHAMGCGKQVFDAWTSLVKRTVERDQSADEY